MGEQFVRLDYRLLDSEAWLGLSNSARVAYVQIKATMYRRDSRGKRRNPRSGELYIGYSDMKGAMSRNTYTKAMRELIDAGFLDELRAGSFPHKKGLYALSDVWEYGGRVIRLSQRRLRNVG